MFVLIFVCLKTSHDAHVGRSAWSKLKTTGHQPSPRYCAAMGLYKDSLIVFGGFDGSRNNSIYSLHLPTSHWSLLLPAVGSSVPMPRSHHCLAIKGTSMYIFGGLSEEAKLLCDLHVFDLERLAWKALSPTGNGPCGRINHSAHVLGNFFVVFGGYDGKFRLNDIFFLNLDTGCWTIPLIHGTPPSRRLGHASVVAGDKLVIFGGDDGNKDRELLNDLHILDLPTMKWYTPELGGCAPPQGRAQASFCTTSEDVVWLIDGSNSQKVKLDEVYRLDLAQLSLFQKMWIDRASATILRDLTEAYRKILVRSNISSHLVSKSSSSQAGIHRKRNSVAKIGLSSSSSASSVAQSTNNSSASSSSTQTNANNTTASQPGGVPQNTTSSLVASSMLSEENGTSTTAKDSNPLGLSNLPSPGYGGGNESARSGGSTSSKDGRHSPDPDDPSPLSAVEATSSSSTATSKPKGKRKTERSDVREREKDKEKEGKEARDARDARDAREGRETKEYRENKGEGKDNGRENGRERESKDKGDSSSLTWKEAEPNTEEQLRPSRSPKKRRHKTVARSTSRRETSPIPIVALSPTEVSPATSPRWKDDLSLWNMVVDDNNGDYEDGSGGNGAPTVVTFADLMMGPSSPSSHPWGAHSSNAGTTTSSTTSTAYLSVDGGEADRASSFSNFSQDEPEPLVISRVRPTLNAIKHAFYELSLEKDQFLKLRQERLATIAEAGTRDTTQGQELKRLHQQQKSKVTLNVGGRLFTTSVTTLSKYPDSMLATMFSGRHTLIAEQDGTYFIDRDGTYFHYILNYLRCGDDVVLEAKPSILTELLAEARFYQLEGLKDALLVILSDPDLAEEPIVEY